MSDRSLSCTTSGFNRRIFMASVAGTAAVIPLSARGAGDLANAAAAWDPSLSVDMTLRVNGEDRTLSIDARTTMLDALREHLGLTGSKRAAITVSAAHARCWWMAVAWSLA